MLYTESPEHIAQSQESVGVRLLQATMPAVSTAMWCVVLLTLAYFFVWTLYAVLVTMDQFTAARSWALGSGVWTLSLLSLSPPSSPSLKRELLFVLLFLQCSW